MKKNLVIAVSVLGLTAAAVAGAIWPWGGKSTSSGQRIDTAPVIYASFDDAQSQHDGTLVVTVISRDGEYVDHGGDGTPDSPGDPGLPMEHLTARVDEVLSGDESLAGSELTVVQSELGTTSETTPEEHLVPGRKYVIIASEHEPNPGTIEGTARSTPLAGQGVFPVIEGRAVPTRSDVFPETFSDGLVPLAALDEK